MNEFSLRSASPSPSLSHTHTHTHSIQQQISSGLNASHHFVTSINISIAFWIANLTASLCNADHYSNRVFACADKKLVWKSRKLNPTRTLYYLWSTLANLHFFLAVVCSIQVLFRDFFFRFIYRIHKNASYRQSNWIQLKVHYKSSIYLWNELPINILSSNNRFEIRENRPF